MRILHINTNDVSGGAGKAAYRLHNALRSLGQRSSMFVAKKDSEDPDVHVYQPLPTPMDFHNRTKRYIDRHAKLIREFLKPGSHEFTPFDIRNYDKTRPVGADLFTDLRVGFPGGHVLSQMPPSDIIHLHWINRFIDIETFLLKIAKSHSIVWTLHDMNPFTGGCHYDGGCERFTKGCGKCPNLGSTEEQDLSRWIWNAKRKIYSQIDNSRLHLVAPSRWLADECRKSPLIERIQVTVIPNGLDTEIFKPRNREFSRDTLGLPNASKVILFVAHSIEETRKGFSILLQALQNLTGVPGIHLLSVGQKIPHVGISIPHTHVGHVQNERLLSLLYSSADVFVLPSLQDNLPNTVMEALACGLPVAAFEVGGVPDLVLNGINGFLTPPGIQSSFASAISELISDDPLRKEMSENARKIAKDHLQSSACAGAYLNLYKSFPL